jgi:hypothetical protein
MLLILLRKIVVIADTALASGQATSSSFGQIFLSQVNTPRNIQLELRLVF